MTKHARDPAYVLPAMMARLAMASWETIIRRSLMMAQGTCTPTEYLRMGEEKVAAMQSSMLALARGRSQAAVLAPFVSRTRANVKRRRVTLKFQQRIAPWFQPRPGTAPNEAAPSAQRTDRRLVPLRPDDRIPLPKRRSWRIHARTR
jgi:hypothetical protein